MKNIKFILFIEDIDIWDKSIDFNELHPKNILLILLIFSDLKWDKSIDTMFSTFLS